MAITNYNDKNNKNNITVIMKIIIIIMMIMTIKKKLSLKNCKSYNTSHELLSDQWIVKRSRFYAS